MVEIVFIYFLQKKGWLGIEKDETGKFREWGTGHKDFLKRLYNKDIVGYNNFFNDILEPLFYEALAKDRVTENDYYSRFRCKIPFLNGGLFEPLGGYNWTDTDILLDNKIFEKIIKTFDLYNFTVKEDEPLEKEVAIDPEMLGKVFENLLEVKDRKSKGSYYTPREIVYYMCQESLIGYLKTRTGIEKKHIDGFLYNGEITSQIRDNGEKIDRLLKDIKVVDPAIGSGAFPVGMMAEIIKARATLTKLFPKEKKFERTLYNFKRECIEESLYGVDIDPGAVDIAQLRLWLSLIVDETDIHKIKPLPNLDYKIMCGNSLLDEFEGVKLFDERLFGETQKIDYLEVNNTDEAIKRLYQELKELLIGKKKDAGRSTVIKKEINKLKKKKQELITSPQKEGNYGSLFEIKKIKESQKKLKEIKELHKRFFNEHDRRNKIALRAEIEKMDWEFIGETLKEQGNDEAKKKLEQIKKTRSKPFFLWKLYFSDVFQENGGFDVVIANPPYFNIRKDLILQEKCKNLYPEIYNGQNDVLYYFVLKGLNLLRVSGKLSFIVARYFLEADSAKKFRAYLLKNNKLLEMIDFGNNQLFDGVNVLNTIISLEHSNKESIEDFKVIKFNRHCKSDEIVAEIDGRFTNNLAEIMLVKQSTLSQDVWIFNNTKIAHLIKKIEDNSFPLGKIAKTGAGIQSGLNEVFVVSDETIAKYKLEKEILRNYIKTRDIKAYLLMKRGLKVIRLTNEEDIERYPNTKRYLNNFRVNLEKRYEAQKGLCKWYAFSVSRNLDIFDSHVEKIITPIYSTSNKFGYDSGKEQQNYLTLSDTAVIQVNDREYPIKAILAILNSKLMDFFYKHTRKLKREGYYEYLSKTLATLPMRYNVNFGKNIDPLVDKISADYEKLSTDDKNTAYHTKLMEEINKTNKKINELVYGIYSITEEEQKIIEEG